MTKDIKVLEISPAVANVPFEEAALDWFENVKVKATSKATYEHIITRHLIPRLKGKTVGQVMKIKFLKELEEELKTEFSERTVANIFVVIRMICRKKIGDFSCLGSATELANSEKVSYMKQKEVIQLLRYFKDANTEKSRSQKRMGVLFALYMGLSTSELCALQWSDVNFERQVIYVYKAVHRLTANNSKNSKLEILELDEEREIPINRQLEVWLNKAQITSGDNFIISNSQIPVDPRTMQNYLKVILDEAEIRNPYTFLELRNTFVVKALTNGAEVKSLANILGITLARLEKAYNEFLVTRSSERKAVMEKVTF